MSYMLKALRSCLSCFSWLTLERAYNSRMRRHLFVVFFLLLAVACSAPAPQGPDPIKVGLAVNAVADSYLNGYLNAFPENALAIGARDPRPSILGDHSLAAMKQWEQKEDGLLAQLKAIDIKPIEERPEGLTYKFLQHLIEASQGFRVCRTELWNVSPTWTGWQASLPVLAGMEATDKPARQEDAFARWSQVPKWLDDEIANLQEGLKLGYTAPKGNVQSVIEQVQGMMTAPISDSPFVQMAKANAPASFRKRLEDLEKGQIRPAMTKYRDFLTKTYLPAAREAIGVTANPQGAACYAAAVKYHATVDMSAKEIHDLGLAQMEKITTEMKEIGRRSFGTEDPKALLTLVKTEPKYRFKSREELITYAESAVERA